MRVFGSPSRYVQGKDVFKTGLDHIKDLGNNPLLLCGNFVWGLCGEELKENLEKLGMKVTHVKFNGESSFNEINRVAKIGADENVDVIIGLGGGKTIDAAKAVADQMKNPVAILPTAASTDAPTSALSVIYTDDGVFEKYIFYKKNPELVMIDTKIISKSPIELLIAGIGDALGTCVEARAVARTNGDNFIGGKQTLAALAIAETCEANLFEYSLLALEANRAKVVTPALETIVEVNTLLSGLGFEACGLAAAHAVHNGFTGIKGEIHDMMHGYKVAYGVLVQLFLENQPKEIVDKYVKFIRSVGLPSTLKELHLENVTYEELLKVGEVATAEGETIHNMFCEVTPAIVADAILAVDSYVNNNF